MFLSEDSKAGVEASSRTLRAGFRVKRVSTECSLRVHRRKAVWVGASLYIGYVARESPLGLAPSLGFPLSVEGSLWWGIGCVTTRVVGCWSRGDWCRFCRLTGPLLCARWLLKCALG